MKTKEETFIVGNWYVVTYKDGAKRRFQFLGGEPPKVYVEGEGEKTLAEVLCNYVKIEPVTE